MKTAALVVGLFYFFAGSFIREVPRIDDHTLDCKKSTIVLGVCEYFVYVEDSFCLDNICIYDSKEFSNE